MVRQPKIQSSQRNRLRQIVVDIDGGLAGDNSPDPLREGELQENVVCVRRPPHIFTGQGATSEVQVLIGSHGNEMEHYLGTVFRHIAWTQNVVTGFWVGGRGIKELARRKGPQLVVIQKRGTGNAGHRKVTREIAEGSRAASEVLQLCRKTAPIVRHDW